MQRERWIIAWSSNSRTARFTCGCTIGLTSAHKPLLSQDKLLRAPLAPVKKPLRRSCMPERCRRRYRDPVKKGGEGREMMTPATYRSIVGVSG